MRFEYELSLIKNKEINSIVKEALEKAPEGVWDRPASSTMKYHPLNENGGIETVYQHTQRVVAMAATLLSNPVCVGEADNGGLSEEDRDILIASAILHDSCKYGLDDPANEKYTKFEHPILVSQLLPSDNGGYWDRIGKTVASHSGSWNTSKYSDVELPLPKTLAEKLLHEADYLASRKNIQIYSCKNRSLFARLREAVAGWWTDRKISRKRKPKQQK